ncbi:MAG: preprotein translocase subunit SecY [Alphaproteobacteria bacterium]|nr:MAG: preprotein translocase subunit SecY [Alphaproteobacteria bacterium]
MATSSVQQMNNLSFGSLFKAEELKKRLLFLVGALVIYRIGTYIPLPGIDMASWSQLFETQSQGILGMFNTFAGGAVERMSILSLGIMPYISASIIMQLGTTVFKRLEEWKKEGEQGRKKINQITRYLTVLFSGGQALVIARSLQASGAAIDPGYLFIISVTITLVGGTMFLMWLGEQVTSRGVGNGISLIIFSGIVAGLPRAIVQMLELNKTGAMSTVMMIAIVLGLVGMILIIVRFERAQRRLLIQFPKRQVGNRQFGGQSSHLPLKLNSAGVIPPIFASSLLMLPQTAVAWMASGGPEWLTFLSVVMGRGHWLYLSLYAALIVFFCFFYTSIVVNPEDTAENLKKQGGFVPGIRPGRRTAEYIDFILTRLTAIGALYLAAICLIPEYALSNFSIPFYLGGTSFLIVVSVTMDTVTQIQSHLFEHQYEGLIKKARLRGNKS